MVTAYTDYIWGQIEAEVRRLERHLMRGVLPRHVQAWLPYRRAEGSLRRDMVRMWERGRLKRIGAIGARRGYLSASEDERELFARLPDVVQGLCMGVAGEKIVPFMRGVSAEAIALEAGVQVVIAQPILDWLVNVGKLVRLDNGCYRRLNQLEQLSWRQCRRLPYGVTRVA